MSAGMALAGVYRNARFKDASICASHVPCSYLHRARPEKVRDTHMMDSGLIFDEEHGISGLGFRV